MVTRWGDMPILRENTQENVPRDPAEQVWNFIEEELELALDLLGSSKSYYYVSHDAAVALMARVKLSRGKKTEAAELAESLIGKYKLDDFEKIFRKAANTEIIFAFENLSEESGLNISDLFYTYAHENKGQGVYYPTKDLLAVFSDEDKRKEITFTSVAGQTLFNKYPSGQTGKDPVIVSRVAEMYLISAEAQGRPNGGATQRPARSPWTDGDQPRPDHGQGVHGRRDGRAPQGTGDREFPLLRFGSYRPRRGGAGHPVSSGTIPDTWPATPAQPAAGTKSRIRGLIMQPKTKSYCKKDRYENQQ